MKPKLFYIGLIPDKPNILGFLEELTRKTPEIPLRITRITSLLGYCGSVLNAISTTITVHLQMYV